MSNEQEYNVEVFVREDHGIVRLVGGIFSLSAKLAKLGVLAVLSPLYLVVKIGRVWLVERTDD